MYRPADLTEYRRIRHECSNAGMIGEERTVGCWTVYDFDGLVASAYSQSATGEVYATYDVSDEDLAAKTPDDIKCVKASSIESIAEFLNYTISHVSSAEDAAMAAQMFGVRTHA